VILLLRFIPLTPTPPSMIRLTTSARHQAVVDRQGTSAYHRVTPERRQPSLTFPSPALFQIPNQPGCDLRHFESKWLCWSNQRTGGGADFVFGFSSGMKNQKQSLTPRLWLSVVSCFLSVASGRPSRWGDPELVVRSGQAPGSRSAITRPASSQVSSDHSRSILSSWPHLLDVRSQAGILSKHTLHRP